SKAGGVDKVNELHTMIKAKEASIEKQMLCIEDKLREDANDGGDQVKRVCGLRGDTDQWASCVAREATKYDKLNDDLIACAAYKSQPGLMHDLIESIACPFGIKSWCQTSDSTP